MAVITQRLPHYGRNWIATLLLHAWFICLWGNTPHLPSADCGDQIKTQLNYDCWYAKPTNLNKNMAAQTRKTTLPLSDFTFRQLKLFFFLFFVLGAVENDVA